MDSSGGEQRSRLCIAKPVLKVLLAPDTLFVKGPEEAANILNYISRRLGGDFVSPFKEVRDIVCGYSFWGVRPLDD